MFERVTVNLQMKGKPLNLQIWDTAGGYAGLRGREGSLTCPEAKPYSFLLNQGGQPITKGQVLARVRVPRNPNPLCLCACVCRLPQPRVAKCILQTRGNPERFPLKG